MIVMISGGVDSFLASQLYPNATKLFVDYGQKYVNLELKAIQELYMKYEFVKISGLRISQDDDYYIPARNLMLATIGLQFGQQICFAGMKDELCADKNPEAFADMTKLLNKQAKGNIRIFSPFWTKTKAQAIAEYLEHDGNKELLKKTVSCYEGTNSQCLNCQACFRRWVALTINGIETERPSEEIIRNYGLQNLHNMNESRIESIFEVLGNVNIIKLEDAVQNQIDISKDDYVVLITKSKKINHTEQLLKENNIRFDAIWWEFSV